MAGEAGYADGSELGTITLMHNTSEGHARIAQAIAAMWKDTLNVDMAVENQEWAVYLNTVQNDTPIEEVPHVFRYGLVRRLRRAKQLAERGL